MIERLRGRRILCFCEGAAEFDIINMLLESDKLIFEKKDLIDQKIHYRQKVSAIEQQYLALDYGTQELVILRVIDSKSENFPLSKPYRGRFDIVTAITKPEIEILLIIAQDDYQDFCKMKSREKPSEFCKRVYGMSKLKTQGFMRTYFSDVEQLIYVLSKYKSMNNDRNGYTIWDMLKDPPNNAR